MLLKKSNNSISLTDIALRVDPPNDTRNSLDWHQDSSYFRQNNNSFNGTVLWCPIYEINEKTGGIDLLQKSFHIGPQNVKRKKSKKGHSSQRSLDISKLEKFKVLSFNNLKLGDAIFMNMDMVHRSGLNTSSKCRISLIGRYHNTVSGDFNSGLNIFKYSDKNLNKEVHEY